MIKIQPIVREIVMRELEAYFALTNNYMNMSSYAYRIRPMVEALTSKNSEVVEAAKEALKHTLSCQHSSLSQT